MDLWLKESQIEDAVMTYRVKQTLIREKTEYQDLAIVDTYSFGRMLVLDGIVQTTVRDEYVYHEMITHIPLFTHPNPKKVLVVGGGDGGAVKEILKHPTVEKVVLCEIDGEVVKQCKKYLPEISFALEDPKCEIFIGDGIKYVHEHRNSFDVVIVDSTDPFGAAEGLFGGSFYKEIYECLTKDGIFVAQTETPFYLPEVVRDVYKDAKAVFPITKLFMAGIPTYPSGFWSFTLGSKRYDPQKVNLSSTADINTKYYTKELHIASFVLPKFIEDLIR
ncbi:polyamine aminopropyltransferase [Clostridium luticellarii]|jgi:spermidine synthase|uniref:Polyamine aminopropyltransferase n=1 Tax=Clostridium luticellarii TaxID=1691940 RepID=A0A2T0BQZ4_9CLOT|nr:polyamine aminopropyltransferase [Clostridium luticellarii]MCI1944312.1 polyamine aminopropyltransferase [Clostridium luticellarii]MCI1967808.1 polyamine aminopropyltransferase [Clostridium luticellarii]MCI1994686.1 polyamine aminopropyltransferase [Clostridium luticellarii]MCI2038817.1 polyamine aminopropyltransferase [Clostridium luticellarii]PRR86300.1 Spermidine synthase [Clostridium luticellarii]